MRPADEGAGDGLWSSRVDAEEDVRHHGDDADKAAAAGDCAAAEAAPVLDAAALRPPLQRMSSLPQLQPPIGQNAREKGRRPAA